MAKPVEGWFHDAILTGLQKLALLNLDRTPACDTLPGTALAWIETLWPTRCWRQDIHEPRIAEAFRILARDRETWPPPAAFLIALPAWNPTTLALKKLLTEEQREANKAKVDYLVREFLTKSAA